MGKRKTKTVDSKQRGANPWGHYRKPPALTEDVRSFQLKEVDGVKVLEKGSNDTASVICHEGSALEGEILQALTYSQRMAANREGNAVAVDTLRLKFPMVDKYCDDDQIQAIACSDAGAINARKEAIGILAERLQIKPTTVERYFRKPTASKGKE